MSEICIAVSIFRASTARNLVTVFGSAPPSIITVGGVWKRQTVWLQKQRQNKSLKPGTRTMVVSSMWKARRCVENRDLKACRERETDRERLTGVLFELCEEYTAAREK